MTIKASNKCTSDESDADQANEMISLIGHDNDEHFYINSDQYMPDDSEIVESCIKITINRRLKGGNLGKRRRKESTLSNKW